MSGADEVKPTAVQNDDARIAELRARKAKREAEREQAFKAQELELLELLEKCEAEIGPQGVDFEIIDVRDLGEGIIVVKRGAGILHERFIRSKQTPADVYDYVLPNVAHPDTERLKAILGRRTQLIFRCGNALAILYGSKKEETAGKY